MGLRMSKISSFPRVVKQEIDAAAARAFTWGEHDCCMWACDVVQKITGRDPCTPFRGTYHDLMHAVDYALVYFAR